MSEPVISVVIVSDYAGGTDKAWDDIGKCLQGLAAQAFEGPVEHLLIEWEGYRDSMPAGLMQHLPRLQVLFSGARTAFELKNTGVCRAQAPLVAILDADCVPGPGWLSAAVETFRAHPEAAAVTGRTLSPGRSRLERIQALSGRAVGDEGQAGPTRHLGLNNVAYRREVYLRHPLSLAAGTCGHRLQSEAILRSGGRLYFEPAMEVVHDSLTWPREKDVRRLMGMAIIATRQVDPRQPFAWLVRLRYGSIPIFVIGKTVLTAYRCWLRHRHHGVRWYELPAAVAAGLVRHLLEVPGMILAFRGQPAGRSRYR
jgi:hypothetical protein